VAVARKVFEAVEVPPTKRSFIRSLVDGDCNGRLLRRSSARRLGLRLTWHGARSAS